MSLYQTGNPPALHTSLFRRKQRKIERFNRTLDSFLAEIATVKPKDLKSLNQLLDVWLAECYQTQPHRGLEANTSPALAFQQDSEAEKPNAGKTTKECHFFRDLGEDRHV